MGRICLQMLRKRAEHNEGIVSSLEARILQEVSLHQQDIEKIEGLGQLCKHLKICLLQNNLISKIENLHKLKELQYLNLALNNITKVQNLQRCESLTKLDLTVNFIDKKGLLSIPSLSANHNLRDLYLLGNPCADLEGFRPFVVASLPALQRLDGVDIRPSERIAALQDLPAIRAGIIAELRSEGVDVDAAMAVEDARDAADEPEADYDADDGLPDDAPRPWSIETRMREHRAAARQREDAERQKQASSDKLLAGDGPAERLRGGRTGFDPLPSDGGRIYQKNEGEWEFFLGDSEDGAAVVLDLRVGKFLDTSLIEVDVQPRVVRCLVKGLLLQLVLPEARPESPPLPNTPNAPATTRRTPAVSPALPGPWARLHRPRRRASSPARLGEPG